MPARLFRVILPAADIERAVAFYATVLEQTGRRVSPERHYFDCGQTILALVSPPGATVRPNSDHVYFAVDDLEAALDRVKAAGPSGFDVPSQAPGIADRPWHERSFYCQDPTGNPICFVATGTEYTGEHPIG